MRGLCAFLAILFSPLLLRADSVTLNFSFDGPVYSGSGTMVATTPPSDFANVGDFVATSLTGTLLGSQIALDAPGGQPFDSLLSVAGLGYLPYGSFAFQTSTDHYLFLHNDIQVDLGFNTFLIDLTDQSRNGLVNLAIVPAQVPEPSVPALLLVGCIGVLIGGYVMRQREMRPGQPAPASVL